MARRRATCFGEFRAWNSFEFFFLDLKTRVGKALWCCDVKEEGKKG